MSERRILIVTNRVPHPLKDGGNLAMRAMIDGYRDLGWQVFLLMMNTTRHYVKEEVIAREFSNLAGYEAVPFDNNLNKWGILKNFLFDRQPEHARRFYTAEFEARLVAVLQSFRPHAIQMESVFLAEYLPAVRDNSSAVTVLRMHNVEYQIWQGLAKKTSNKLKAIYLDNLATRVRNYERKAWHSFDKLLAITEKDAHLVVRLENADNVMVAPFGIDTNKVRPTGGERWVGYHLGAMDWLPNQEGIKWFLEKVWKRVRKSTPDFEFYFAGRSMPETFMNIKIEGVTCMGEVEDAAAFVADKKILIVPLLSGGGIRVKILEAMAQGKVVISTSKGIKGIEAMPDEHYLRVHSADDMAKAIDWCVRNPEQAEKLAMNARQLVLDKYDQHTIARNVSTAIEQLIDQIR